MFLEPAALVDISKGATEWASLQLHLEFVEEVREGPFSGGELLHTLQILCLACMLAMASRCVALDSLSIGATIFGRGSLRLNSKDKEEVRLGALVRHAALIHANRGHYARPAIM